FERSKSYKELSELAEIKQLESRDQQVIKENSKDVDVIITGSPISAEVINSAERLKLIQTTSVGYDHIDEEAAIANGVIICNVAESNANSVAEICFGMILDLARRISAHDRLMREGGWGRVEMERQIEIRHKTLGIVGLGAIGSRMAQIGANAFEMTVLANDPYITGDRADQVCALLVDLPTVMKKSDVVTIHVPLNEETRHMIGEKELRMMKPTAIFINASRGPVVDEKALIKILKEERISGAGLDVFEEEPLPKDSPLRRLENVVIVPHIGSSSEALAHMVDVAVHNVLLVAKGKEPMRIKTPEVYYSSPKWR
ncbi:MAG: hydroxyacid dehydrogenase, partial [Candidatus Bathyarchaeota archaeon]